MELNTIADVKLYIKNNYDLEPKASTETHLEYDRVVISKNTDNQMEVNFEDSANMWTVARTGHTVDYCRADDLLQQIGPGGGLVYFLFPIERSMDAI
jgi:hypothetical protein